MKGGSASLNKEENVGVEALSSGYEDYSCLECDARTFGTAS